MMKKTLVVFVLLISSIQTSLLSQAENENRLAMCGRKYFKQKVFQGRVANQKEAPWAVMLLTEVTTGALFWKKKTVYLCSGSVISPRHILTATHCLSGPPDENRQRTVMNSEYDVKNCDSDSNYVLKDRSALDNIHIYSFDDQHKIIDGKNIEKVTMVRGCVKIPIKNREKEDFAIIHLIKDLTFSDTLQPICVAYNRAFNQLGIPLGFYGFGRDPPPNTDLNADKNFTGQVLRFEIVKVISMNAAAGVEHQFAVKDPKKKTMTCPGDSGGGSFLIWNKQARLVGVMSSAMCQNQDDRENGWEYHSSVGFYANTTCQLTGVCEANMYKYWFGITDPPTTTTSTTTTTVAPTTTISTTTEPSTTEDQTTTISSTTVAPTSTLTSKAPTTISSEAPVTTAAETTTELELITQKMYYRTDEEFEPLSLALSSSAGARTIALLVFLVLLLLE